MTAFRSNSPDVAAIPVDTDGDGTPEYFAPDADNDGKADRNDDGTLQEVPGTREAFAGLDQADTDIGEIVTIASVLLGIPGGGLIGQWIGRRKPVKRFNSLVQSIDAAKQEDSPEAYITLSKETLEAVQAEQPGLVDLIRKVREANKKKKT